MPQDPLAELLVPNPGSGKIDRMFAHFQSPVLGKVTLAGTLSARDKQNMLSRFIPLLSSHFVSLCLPGYCGLSYAMQPT